MAQVVELLDLDYKPISRCFYQLQHSHKIVPRFSIKIRVSQEWIE